MDISFFDKAAGYLPDECFSRPVDVGILLGSGWSDALTMDEVHVRISYGDIPGLGASTVKGHAGEFILYTRGGKRIAAWCGRRHYYEGVGWEPVVLPVEILRRMSCKTLIVTNAAGGINPALRPGDFVIIRDHINTVGMNPLVGAHRPEWGERFPDMTEVYNKRLCELIDRGEELPLDIKDSIIYFVGPTPAKPGQAIGSAGPTTSYRMDAYSPSLIAIGQTGMIGKGKRGPEVIDAMKEHGAVYFGAIGGCGALLSKCIKKAEVIAYDDLGAEAIRRLEVEDFPVVVIIDSLGNNLYETGRADYLAQNK